MEVIILYIQDVEGAVHVLVQSPRKPYNVKWIKAHVT
jgi:hypothetical protein